MFCYLQLATPQGLVASGTKMWLDSKGWLEASLWHATIICYLICTNISDTQTWTAMHVNNHELYEHLECCSMSSKACFHTPLEAAVFFASHFRGERSTILHWGLPPPEARRFVQPRQIQDHQQTWIWPLLDSLASI